jgi:tRNA1(Val) A37 N6-methylase TrmN6
MSGTAPPRPASDAGPDGPALTRDALLGGRVHLWQPARGYRAGVDPVLLAAACPARPGARVLELGCGAGAAALCLAARVPGLAITGVERDAGMAALARRNAAEAGAAMEVVTADLRALPAPLRQIGFDHVIANPPYFDRAASQASADTRREAALGEETPLADWLDTAARRLAPKGWLTLIHRAERLADVLAGLGRLGSVAVQPLVPRAGKPARLILVRARKGGRAPLMLHDGLVLHAGARHLRDGEDYTPALRAVLRDGAPLPGFRA